MQLRPYFRVRRARSGKSEVDGSDPPFLLPVSGTAALRKSHLRNAPWGGRSRLKHPLREGQKLHPWRGRIEPDERPERQLGTVPPSVGQGASESANPLLPALWLSRPPEHLSPLRRQVRTHPGQEKETLSFERNCAGCRDLWAMRGPQHCERYGKTTESLLRWMESRPCVPCGRDTRMVEPHTLLPGGL